MPISWNEIRDRAHKFSQDWAEASSEDADAKSFWDAFFDVFGISRRRVGTFEHKVKKIDGKDGFIDMLWKGVLLIEHKSRGRDLTRAYTQAKDYFGGLKDNELPRYILVSDFARFKIYDLDDNTESEFTLKDLPKNIKQFGFIAGYQTTKLREEDPVNIKAAEKMGKLHDRLRDIGYDGHKLEIYLVRMLFCLFAEDSGVFERNQFREFIEQRTAEDGSDLAAKLAELFGILNTPENKRLKTTDEILNAFRYVNGGLFAENLPVAGFDKDMRDILIDCTSLDWSRISPAIFGAMFQSIMDKKLRRNLGAHYTSERNILKLIGPLFLDDLRSEFDSIKTNIKKLEEFHKKIAGLTFLDPACGCGNFLIIAYRELRELELEILRILLPKKYGTTRILDISPEILCNVDQFYGIEIEEFPAQIATTALWLMDHQMNMVISSEFGQYFSRLPLAKSATIVNANALTQDWREVIEPRDLSYILGNPPFLGKQYQSEGQKKDLESIFVHIKGAGVLDFVTAWYVKATDLMLENPSIKTAFVSTNSITQGEQVGILWPDLLRKGVKIHFAHRTFEWSNEASGKAAVHCVIIGFALHDTNNKRLFDYADIKGEAHEVKASNINPYLVDASDIFLEKKRMPISQSYEMAFGSMPNDGGFLLFNEEEKNEFLSKEPQAKKFIRPFFGGEEFINNIKRYCLWLVDASPAELKSMPLVMTLLEEIKKLRLASTRKTTNELASSPMIFGEIRQPKTNYLAIPEVSSERRHFIPIGFLTPDIIASNKLYTVSDATPYHFGILTSTMHMAWTRTVCGRLKSDYQYSAGIVYNNFPWPMDVTDKQKQVIADAAQAVLDARVAHEGASLADLYDPLTMPPDLVKAHRALDNAVDTAYSKRKFTGDSDRVAFLFDLYQTLSAPLDLKKPKGKKKKPKSVMPLPSE
jgi:hypothetical protein